MTDTHGSSEKSLLLTIAELARRFELPESTARFYCKRFRDFLPHVGGGKRRRYKPEVHSLFAEIIAEMKVHKDANSVEAVLASRHPRLADSGGSSTAPTPASSQPHTSDAYLELMREQTRALQTMADELKALSAERTVASHAPVPEGLEQRLAEVEKGIQSVKNMLNESEELHQQDLEQLRKWLTQLAAAQSKTS